MAELYKSLDDKAKAGMTTSADKVAAVAELWAKIRADADPTDWAIFRIEGKHYAAHASGDGGVAGLVAAMSASDINFCGLRVDADKGPKFFRLLYVGTAVGAVKRARAQLQKNAPFNAMEGATGDVDVPTDELSAEKITELIAAL
jgi:hypothetical protein